MIKRFNAFVLSMNGWVPAVMMLIGIVIFVTIDESSSAGLVFLSALLFMSGFFLYFHRGKLEDRVREQKETFADRLLIAIDINRQVSLIQEALNKLNIEAECYWLNEWEDYGFRFRGKDRLLAGQFFDELQERPTSKGVLSVIDKYRNNVYVM